MNSLPCIILYFPIIYGEDWELMVKRANVTPTLIVSDSNMAFLLVLSVTALYKL